MISRARTYGSAARANIGNGFTPSFYSDPLWDDQNFDVLAMTVPGNNSAPTAYVIPTTGVTIPKFANGTAVVEVAGSKELEHSWKIGTPIYPHAHVLKLATGAGRIFLGFEYRIISGSTVVYGTKTATLTVTGIAALTSLLFIDFGELSLATITDVGAQVSFRLYRDPTNAADTFNSDIAITTVGWHLWRDTAGSRQVLTK